VSLTAARQCSPPADRAPQATPRRNSTDTLPLAPATGAGEALPAGLAQAVVAAVLGDAVQLAAQLMQSTAEGPEGATGPEGGEALLLSEFEGAQEQAVEEQEEGAPAEGQGAELQAGDAMVEGEAQQQERALAEGEGAEQVEGAADGVAAAPGSAAAKATPARGGATPAGARAASAQARRTPGSARRAVADSTPPAMAAAVDAGAALLADGFMGAQALASARRVRVVLQVGTRGGGGGTACASVQHARAVDTRAIAALMVSGECLPAAPGT